MKHFPRNSTTPAVLDVTLYDASGNPRRNEADTTTVAVTCVDNNNMLQFDNTFAGYFHFVDFGGHSVTGWVLPSNFTTVPGKLPFDNVYSYTFDVSSWPRGNYKARFTADGGSSTEVYEEDFSVGLVCERKLGFSAAYLSPVLTLSIWVEEDGVVQTDYTALKSAQLLDSAGNQITGGNLGDITSPNNGVFTISTSVSLAASHNYILACVAQVDSANFGSPLLFPLRVGLQRP